MFLCSFGDDIPGMEGLGTGEFTSGFKMHSISLSMTCEGLTTLTSPSVCCRHHRHLPLGGLQSPGAAWAGPVRHHLSLPASPCSPLRITGHVHAPQTICLRLHLLALNGTIPNKLPEWPVTDTKNGKRETKIYKKMSFCPLSLDSSSDSAVYTHLLMFRIFWFESHVFCRSALLL